MNFSFTTNIDQKALAAMARALRKTVRKKKSRRSHILGWIVVLLGLLPSFHGGVVIEFRSVVTWLAILAILVTLVWEDGLNGRIAKKRMLPGTEKAVSFFTEEGYRTTTEIGETTWGYEKIQRIAVCGNYYVFVFSANHAQVYDRRSLSGGSKKEFEAFIIDRTGKEIEKV